MWVPDQRPGCWRSMVNGARPRSWGFGALRSWGWPITCFIRSVVGKYLHLHTVPLLIALIGGIIVFGAAGFFVGPVVVALTFGALEVWRVRASVSKTSPGQQA
ncbi:hypothetical protein [Methylocaldum sp.]|uniref:hypothetical protein n=1 Tax=Methylocaldum sp. TaxID=1969727 RepID=UPI002D4681AD|nr:hypothetical protein [Methylocaldum sp.]HYE34331.1 hypothetical protein [Methylocaldum sp.]